MGDMIGGAVVGKDKRAAVLPSTIKKYVSRDGSCPFDDEYDGLKIEYQAAVSAALDRVMNGETVKVKAYSPIFGIVLTFPNKIRIYYGEVSSDIIILLGVGTEKKQSRDIDASKEVWGYFRKHQEECQKRWLDYQEREEEEDD